MPSIVLDEWISLGVVGCRSITATQRRTVPGFFEMQSPISYWTMDEASGTRFDSFGIHDVSPPISDPASAAGIISNAAVCSDDGFTGDRSLQKIGTTGLWVYTTGITMAGWFKFTALGGFGNFGAAGFQLAGAGATTFRLFADNSGNLLAEAKTPVGVASSITIAGVTLNTFMFIRMWADPSDDKVHCRINEGSIQTGAATMTPFTIPALNLFFPKTPLGSAIVDEVGIYAGVLSDTDASFLYNSGAGQRPTLP